MQIAHIALWTDRLEELRDFYVTYFGGISNQKYVNTTKGFESFFISFDSGCTLELMRRSDIKGQNSATQLGLCHFAIGANSREQVVKLTEQLRAEGIQIIGEPRTSGDGYFESVVADPDGNLIEIVYK